MMWPGNRGRRLLEDLVGGGRGAENRRFGGVVTTNQAETAACGWGARGIYLSRRITKVNKKWTLERLK
jgi:hypothetical protein